MRDTSVVAVLQEIRRQTDIDFIFNHEELEKVENVSVELSRATVDEVLTMCLENTGLSYMKTSNTIVITPQKNDASQKLNIKTQTIRGIIRDRDSRMTMPFASVFISNSTLERGASTDIDGNFRFDNLPVGRYTIRVSYVGYTEAILPEILLGSVKEVVLSIDISEQTESIGEVLIRYKKWEPLNQMATVSSRSFSVEESKRYPASISDPARMALIFAGVTGTDDATNEIVIRGNSPNWMLWKLEGVEIPSPNHFAEEGFTSGSVSILSTNLIGMSDFYTGAFPAEYGSALSGVFDIKLRSGNNEKKEYSFQAGLLGLELSAEGPFKEGSKGSYLLNYRYSSLTLLGNFGINIAENALPNYQDLNFKFNIPTKKSGTFSFWGIGGKADDNETYIPDSLAGEDSDVGYRDYTISSMYALGLTHTIFPDDKSYIKTSLSNSLSYSSESLYDMNSRGIFDEILYDNLRNKALRISTMYNKKASQALTFRTGLTYSYLYYDYFSRQFPGSVNQNTVLNSRGNTSIYEGFVESKLSLSDKVILNTGLHYTHFALSKDNSLEPRVGIKFLLPSAQSLSFGFGLHSKNESLPVYFSEIQLPDGNAYMPNLSLQMTRSLHFVAGYEKMLLSDLQLKSEIYYQKIYKLAVPDSPNKYWAPIYGGVNAGDTLANIGEARNYGIEVTLQKYFTDGYYFLYSGSLFDAKYKPADGNWYDTKYNVRFINNLVGGKEFMWGDSRMVGVNLRMIWSGGKRIIPLDLPASIAQGVGVYKDHELYSDRTNDYFRIDFSFKFHFFREKTEHIVSLDIQNLTNRKNVLAIQYDPVNKKPYNYYMAPRIPIFNYRLEF